MLHIEIPASEYFDDETQTFHSVKAVQLQLEHSLVSLSKWESKWCKPFLTTKLTTEETRDYVRCMTITQNVNPLTYLALTDDHIAQINRYIDAPMTATTFSNDPTARHGRTIITAEIIYYNMIAYQIPFECQKWHLNRLLTLINVCRIKNSPPKKMGFKEQAMQNRALNEARRKAYNTKG